MRRPARTAVGAVAVALAGCSAVGGPTRAPSRDLGVVVPDPPLRTLAGRPDGPRTGAIKWQRRLEGPVVPGPIEGPDGLVLAAANAGVLHALDPATTSPLALADGTVLWPGPDGLIYFGDHLGRINGLDARIGDGTIDSYPTLTSKGLLIIGSESGVLTAIGS